MPIDIATITTGKEAYDLAKELGLVEKLLLMFKKKQKILLLGASGAGKTQFRESLINDMPQIIHHADRTAAVNKKTLALANEMIAVINDTPGQKGHATRRFAAIKDAMREAHVVINVVSHGYHETDVPAEEAITKAGKVRQEFLKHGQAVEIDLLHEWNRILSIGIQKPRLITLVTKADLWWEEKETVKAWYETGPYRQALGPAEEMNPVVCLYSSVSHRFFSKSPISGYFDDTERLRLRASFFRVLEEVIGIGK